MMRRDIRVFPAPDGVLTYVIVSSPTAVPAISPLALAHAWEAAHAAALARQWGRPRRFLFCGSDGALQEMALVDRDAACWAEAVDALQSLETDAGLALCLRLLALIEVLTRVRLETGFLRLTAEGLVLDPAVLRVAATLPLDGAARFDETAFRCLIARTPLSGVAP